MTRFAKEVSGQLGEYWKAEAQKELNRIQREIDNGEITFDAYGVARNSIGRVVMDDLAEKIAYVTDKINLINTKNARDKEVAEELKDYVCTTTDEMRYEMKATFGDTEKYVVNVITGEKIFL